MCTCVYRNVICLYIQIYKDGKTTQNTSKTQNFDYIDYVT